MTMNPSADGPQQPKFATAAAYTNQAAEAAAPLTVANGRQWGTGSPPLAPASHRTSPADLSGRQPRQTGWRSLPSFVASVNFTSPTNLGVVQTTSRRSAAGMPSTGGVFRSIFCSRAAASCNSRSENPEPTLPTYRRRPPSFTASSNEPRSRCAGPVPCASRSR